VNTLGVIVLMLLQNIFSIKTCCHTLGCGYRFVLRREKSDLLHNSPYFKTFSKEILKQLLWPKTLEIKNYNIE
jgi:hypothetical protein